MIGHLERLRPDAKVVRTQRRALPAGRSARRARRPRSSTSPRARLVVSTTKFEVARRRRGPAARSGDPEARAGLSRRKARAVIDLGGVFVDRARVKVAGRPVQAGPEDRGQRRRRARAARRSRRPSRGSCSRDDHVIVVDKPAGLVTAPTPESESRRPARSARRSSYGEVYLVHRHRSADERPARVRAHARGEQAARRRVQASTTSIASTAPSRSARSRAQTIDRPIDRHAARSRTSRPSRRCAGATLVVVPPRDRPHPPDPHPPRRARPSGRRRSRARRRDRARTFVPRPPRLALHAVRARLRAPGDRRARAVGEPRCRRISPAGSSSSVSADRRSRRR